MRRKLAGFSAAAIAVASLVGVTLAQHSAPFPYTHGTSTPAVALTMCSGPMTRGWECDFGSGVCIPVQGMQCAQTCWDANGHPTIRGNDIQSVGCFDS